MPKKETKLVVQFRERLNEYEESFFFKIHGGPMQMAGISDLVGVFRGRFVAIEVKTPENRKGPTKIQAWFLDRVNKCGGVGFVARSWSEIEAKISSLW